MLATKSNVFVFFFNAWAKQKASVAWMQPGSFQPLGPSKLHHLEPMALQDPASHTPSPPTILIYLKFSGIVKTSQTH